MKFDQTLDHKGAMIRGILTTGNHEPAQAQATTWQKLRVQSLGNGRPKVASPSNKALMPKGPCTYIADTLILKYLYRDSFKSRVCTTSLHGNPKP